MCQSAHRAAEVFDTWHLLGWSGILHFWVHGLGQPHFWQRSLEATWRFTNGAARGRQDHRLMFCLRLSICLGISILVTASWVNQKRQMWKLLPFSEAMGYPKSFLERHVEGMQVASISLDRHWVGILPAICQETMASFGWGWWREHSKRWMGEFFRQGGLFWSFRTYF